MTRRSTRDILIAAKARIADPENWCQKNYFLDADGKPISHEEFAARRADIRKYCTLGSVYATVENDEGDWAARHALHGAAQALYGKNAHVVNDEDGHAAVMAVYDRAIANATDSDE